MKIIQEFKIYLMGASKNLSFDEQNVWRNTLKEYFEKLECNYRVKVINPNDYFNYYEKTHKTQKQIKDFLLGQLRTSDLVIVNLDYSNGSVGTGQESQHAVDNAVQIVGYGKKEIYPWISECDCQVVFENMDEIIEYVKNYYLL